MRTRLKLGLIVDPEFVLLEKNVVATTGPLVRGLCRTFETRIIYDQTTYDDRAGEVDFLMSMEPRWAAPVLAWRRFGLGRKDLPDVPCYVMMSDPHIEGWREDYFQSQGLDYILALYWQPTHTHFARTAVSQLVHFPWTVPDHWMSDAPIAWRGSSTLAVFGAAQGAAYDLRNWCRVQPGVTSHTESGVENKVFREQAYFDWLAGFDGVIAAGSESSVYRLTTPKYFEAAAAGCLLFAQQTDDLERLGFVDQANCVVFTRETFRAKADEYLAEPGNARWLRLRQAGRELILSRHTLSRRLAELDAHVRAWSGRRRVA
jgi:hypothetical protein